MSKQYICDITGDSVTPDDIGEKVIKQANVNLGGKTVSMELIVRVDAWNGAVDTHIKPDLWPQIFKKVRDWIISQYG